MLRRMMVLLIVILVCHSFINAESPMPMSHTASKFQYPAAKLGDQVDTVSRQGSGRSVSLVGRY